MYYDSKSDFYIRQYGPKIGILVLSVALIVGGVYIYISTGSNPNVVTAVNNNAPEENIEEINSLQEVEIEEEPKVEETVVEEVIEEIPEEILEEMTEEDIEISRGLAASLRNLKLLEKTDYCKVDSVTESNSVVVFIGNRYYEINLIGMDYSRSPEGLNQMIKNDLTGKDIKLAFDKLRVKGGQVYAYVYLDEKTSYNEDLLARGLSIIKIERTNTSLLNKLVEAQRYAKDNSIGIWAK